VSSSGAKSERIRSLSLAELGILVEPWLPVFAVEQAQPAVINNAEVNTTTAF
jgi:hypothetical protein